MKETAEDDDEDEDPSTSSGQATTINGKSFASTNVSGDWPRRFRLVAIGAV